MNLGGFECWRTSPVSLHVTSWEGIMYFIVQTKADAQKGGDEAIFGYDFFKKHMRLSQNSLSQSLDNCVIFLFWLKIYKLLMKRAPT